MKTRLDPEEWAYDTPFGTRKARAVCPDGRVRTCSVGIPDTFFSIPARTKVRGKTVTGWVGVEDGEYYFRPTGKNAGIFEVTP